MSEQTHRGCSGSERGAKAPDGEQNHKCPGSRSKLGSLDGLRVGILGLTFKPNTDDVREAPSLRIIRELQWRGARVQAFDPAAMEQALQLLPDVDYRSDPYHAVQENRCFGPSYRMEPVSQSGLGQN
jgi:UDP-glucose/GDP-mannose dehydrogenase family, UDP binding domain